MTDDRSTHPISPDLDAVATFTEVVYGDLQGQVALRLLAERGTPDAKPIARYHPVGRGLTDKLKDAAVEAASRSRALFVVPATIGTAGRATAADILETGVVVVDIDSAPIAAKRKHLVEHLGEPTLEVASGGRTEEGEDKLHLYWQLKAAARGERLALVCRLRQQIAAKVGGDGSFKSAHQAIRVPGSVHAKYGVRSLSRILNRRGVAYELANLAESVDRMPPLPGLAQPKVGARPTARKLMTQPVRAGALDGTTRFDAHSRVIGHWLRLVRLGTATLDEAWDAVQDYNVSMVVPPWPQDRLRREFEALRRKDVATHGQSGSTAPHLSEDALATTFVERHGADWRFVPARGAWLRWDGRRWQRDETSKVRETIRQVCRSAAAGSERSSEARRIASNKTIRAVEQIAGADPLLAIPSDALDADPMLCNTPAEVLDLATGEQRLHDPDLLMTQLSGASLGSGCRRWLGFIDEITDGDGALAGYLQRVAGYCLTGSTKEQVFAFLHGEGANGKSVFLQAISMVLGDYAATAPLETFMASRSDRHSTELAGLMGKRLVTVTETETGRAWAESRIKTITGGEPIRARFMHKDHFEFTPTFKLLVAGNHKPSLTGVGEAMRRRLHLVPFSVTIPPERRDKDLMRQLRDERDGILGWMVAGCADWQRTGLAPPAAVLEASEEYFADEDLVSQWIAECCVTGNAHRASASLLYSSWSGWAEARGLETGSHKALGEALRTRRFRQSKVGGARAWRGIAPRHAAVAEAAE